MNNSLTYRCLSCDEETDEITPAITASETKQIYTLQQCQSCGLVQTLPQPENLSFYYTEKYYGNRHGCLKRFRFRQRRKIVLSAYPAPPDAPVLLDIGCGDGSFLDEMAAAGWRVFGTELSLDATLEDNGRVKKSLEEVKSFGPFDCITLWHSLEHMPDIHHLLMEVHDLLTAHGRLIIAVPNICSIQAQVFKDFWLALDIPRHLFHFSPASLKRILQQNDFCVTQQLFQEIEYDIMGWVQSSLNRVFHSKDTFFDLMRGKKPRLSYPLIAVHVITGVLLIPIVLPLVFIERWLKRSGTMITIATRAPTQITGI